MGISGLLKKALKKIDIDPKAVDALESEQREMIRGIVEFGDTTVKEVMVPRIDTEALPEDISKEDLLSRLAASDHSRFPVYGESVDNVIGILYVKDVLRALVQGDSNTDFQIAALARPAFFVPESKHIDDLLREFQKKKVHIAVVVDEYGGVSGIVCMEDILEEIIGDIQDEFDNEREDITALEDGSYLCDTRVNLEDLSEKTALTFPSDDFDTLGGFVFNLFGKIPERGESVLWNDIEFTVTEIEGHRINTVKVTVAG